MNESCNIGVGAVVINRDLLLQAKGRVKECENDSFVSFLKGVFLWRHRFLKLDDQSSSCRILGFPLGRGRIDYARAYHTFPDVFVPEIESASLTSQKPGGEG